MSFRFPSRFTFALLFSVTSLALVFTPLLTLRSLNSLALFFSYCYYVQHVSSWTAACSAHLPKTHTIDDIEGLNSDIRSFPTAEHFSAPYFLFLRTVGGAGNGKPSGPLHLYLPDHATFPILLPLVERACVLRTFSSASPFVAFRSLPE